MKLDHLTAIVESADGAASALSRLLGVEPVGSVALAGMRIVTFRIGDVELHVNSPTGQGPVEAHLKRHGPGFHHLALAVGDLDATLKDLAGRGFATLGVPVETAPGLREVFIDPASTGGVLIQLVERQVEVLPGDLDSSAVAALANIK